MGIFGKGKWEREDGMPRASRGGVLAVWGSPGSGKTTVSVKLAERLTANGNNCLLIFADMTTPVIPYVCPPSDLIGEKSLGSILAAARVDQTLLRQNCMFYKKNRYLSVVGFLKGENRFAYPAYGDEQARQLIEAAREVAPFVIVDCSSHVTTNRLTCNALLGADRVLRLVRCDLKSVSYLSSQLPLLRDARWNADAQMKAASDVRPNEAAGSIDQVLGKVAYKVPHSQEVETQFLEGDLLKELCYKESRAFRAEIDRIAKEAWGL